MGGKRVQPKPKKKRMRKRTKFTILSIFNLTWYAVVVLILNACGHTVDTELTVGWFAAWTAELAILYGIKVKAKARLRRSATNLPIPTAPLSASWVIPKSLKSLLTVSLSAVLQAWPPRSLPKLRMR